MFWTNYERYCKMINKSPNAVAQAIGIASNGTVTGWRSGSQPRKNVINALVKYFNENGLNIDASDLFAESEDDGIDVREMLRNSPEYRILFSAAKDAPPSALLEAASVIMRHKEASQSK